MKFEFEGSIEDFDRVFPAERRDRIINALERLERKIDMQSQELQQLDQNMNELAQVVEEVVQADAAEDKAFQDTIDDLKRQLDEAVAAGQIQKELAESLKTQLDAETEGIGQVNPRMRAVIDALRATGSNPSEPLPPIDIPPAPPEA